MKTKPQALLLALCAVLVVAATVVGTLAYLTDTTAVTNTFTVGKVDIDMTETKVEPSGKPVGDTDGDGQPDRNTGNKYHLIPGKTYTKDPTIFVATDSEESWLFVKIQNDIKAMEDGANTVASQMAANGWKLMDAANDIYAYTTKVKGGDEVQVFSSFTIAGAVDQTDLSEVTNASAITVTAYAIQAEGFDTAQAAWDAVDGKFIAYP